MRGIPRAIRHRGSLMYPIHDLKEPEPASQPARSLGWPNESHGRGIEHFKNIVKRVA